ncbi:MAG: DUF362 domain-containing protein, partial [bacterium]|nr:DUF362 domain-containing protein [bacterium]
GPVRRVLTLLDGIVAGEGDGPLAPNDVPLGVVAAGSDPVAVDLVAVRLMGFDEQLIPKLREPMRDSGARITAVRSASDVVVGEIRVEAGPDGEVEERGLDQIECKREFEPHPGWRGHIERETR